MPNEGAVSYQAKSCDRFRIIKLELQLPGPCMFHEAPCLYFKNFFFFFPKAQIMLMHGAETGVHRAPSQRVQPLVEQNDWGEAGAGNSGLISSSQCHVSALSFAVMTGVGPPPGTSVWL